MANKIFVLFFVLLLGGFCTAQQHLTLNDAIATALKNSYDIKLAKDNLEIAGINNHIGVAGGLPVVNAAANDNETVTSINQKFPDPARNVKRSGVSTNNLTASITGGILLYNGFRVKATKKRLEELEALNQDLLNVQIQNTIAEVSTRYYDIVRQQYFLGTIVKSMEVSKQRITILQNRKDIGLANNADIFQAQLDYNALIQSEKAQQLVIDQGKTDLLNLIFVNPDSAIVINDTIVIDQSIQFNQIKSLAIKNPTIKAAEQQIKINELLERETAALRSPTLRATTGFNLTNTTSAAGFILQNQSYGPFVGLNLAVPIYNGSINKRLQKVAEINTRIAKTQRNGFILTIETGATRTFQAYSNTISQLKTAQENLDLSKRLLDLVLQRFQLGQSTIIDVKIAQQSFENESYRLVNLAYTAKIAEIELKRLANLLQP
ncbi:MAG: TolC family protein [Sphingobacteriia bacterium]|jgi:outer membrane protein|nr:MAG: TolC family protein [Sphingobacteriia bacterium]TAH07665.1 MAG: TolC family protein [Sphingobacteriia bacterium]